MSVDDWPDCETGTGTEMTTEQHPPAAGPVRTVPGGGRVTEPAPGPAWRKVYDSDPDAVPTQSPGWAAAVRAGGLVRDRSALYEFPDGGTAVWPAVGRLPRVGGRALSTASWPHGWGYGGVLAQDGALSPDQVSSVLSDQAARYPLALRLAPMPLRASWYAHVTAGGWTRTAQRTQIVPLEELSDLWKAYRHQARTGVRKAEKQGVEVDVPPAAQGVAVFSELYRRNVDRWAAERGQPLAAARLLARLRDVPGQVAAVSRELGPDCRIWVASRAGEPVGAAVVLSGRQHALGWLSAMDPDLARVTQGTYLLHWRTMSVAQQEGVRQFHMGESDPGSAVERYKRNFAARSVDYDVLHHELLAWTPARAMSRRGAERVLARTAPARQAAARTVAAWRERARG